MRHAGTLCETLKLFHAGGALGGRKVLIMGASGGDMAMTADVARMVDLDFAPIPESQAGTLQDLLTERVTVANPLDIHTYLWFDPPALERVFSTAMRSGYDAVGFMLDFPPEGKADTSSFDAAIDAYIRASRGAPSRVALIASLPETMSARVRRHCLEGGIVPLQGQREALEALAAAAAVGIAWRSGPGVELRLAPRPGTTTAPEVHSLDEAEGKAALCTSRRCHSPQSGRAGRAGSCVCRGAGFPGGHQGRRRASRAQDRGGRRRAQHPFGPAGRRGRAALEYAVRHTARRGDDQ